MTSSICEPKLSSFCVSDDSFNATNLFGSHGDDTGKYNHKNNFQGFFSTIVHSLFTTPQNNQRLSTSEIAKFHEKDSDPGVAFCMDIDGIPSDVKTNFDFDIYCFCQMTLTCLQILFGETNTRLFCARRDVQAEEKKPPGFHIVSNLVMDKKTTFLTLKFVENVVVQADSTERLWKLFAPDMSIYKREQINLRQLFCVKRGYCKKCKKKCDQCQKIEIDIQKRQDDEDYVAAKRALMDECFKCKFQQLSCPCKGAPIVIPNVYKPYPEIQIGVSFEAWAEKFKVMRFDNQAVLVDHLMNFTIYGNAPGKRKVRIGMECDEFLKMHGYVEQPNSRKRKRVEFHGASSKRAKSNFNVDEIERLIRREVDCKDLSVISVRERDGDVFINTDCSDCPIHRKTHKTAKLYFIYKPTSNKLLMFCAKGSFPKGSQRNCKTCFDVHLPLL
jgi:hypothetical protein